MEMLTCQETDTSDIKCNLFRSVTLGGGNQEETDGRNTDTNDGDKPEDPAPASILNKDGSDEDTKDVSDGTSATKEGDGACLV
jgi:hypothetical protein